MEVSSITRGKELKISNKKKTLPALPCCAMRHWKAIMEPDTAAFLEACIVKCFQHLI